ncbi:MAG TPA: endolytic transglycosylase MltG [Terriglobales bacterium]|nr:endolytic transglycosylase MltG [Terriglobales bacterium]
MRTLLTLFLLAILAIAGWIAWQLHVPVTPPAGTFLLLRPGYSSRRIAIELKKAGVIRNERVFWLWHALHRKRSLKAGEYQFERDANLPQVYDRIARGDIYFHVVTIPEGYTMFDIAKAIEDAGLGSAADFLHVARTQTQLISDLSPQAISLEGYLFPNTYQFTRTQTLEEMAAAMVHQFRQAARQIGLNSDHSGPNASPSVGPNADTNSLSNPDLPAIVTMASIVEKETAVAEERPLVAGVYYNRLAKRMALDADPSVIYAELLAGTYQGSLHHADLSVNSAYNTYRFPGLPPGPIGNPGRSSLAAALHPETTDFLYFVADGNGHHRFAQSLEEHNRNVAAYRRALNHSLDQR